MIKEESSKELKIKVKITYLIAFFIVALIFLIIFIFSKKFLIQTTSNETVIISDFDIVLGNSKSNIILLEYSSFECSACRFFHANYFDNIEEAIKNNKIAYVLRLVPFRQSEFSLNLVKAAYCSVKLTNSIEYIKNVFLNFEKIKSIEDSFEYFNGNVEDLKKCINSVEAESYLKNNYKKFIEDNIPGTPTFILYKDGKVQRIVGAQRINLE